MTNTMHPNFPAFLAAFAATAHLEPKDADAQWAGFSDMLTDSEREEIESGGLESGRDCGRQFAEFCGTKAEGRS